MADFDFDHWSRLAQGDPVAFFRARRTAIERFISSHPPGQARRLRDMQRFIDCVRATAGSPLRATEGLIGMMEDRLAVLRRQSAELDAAARGLRQAVGQISRIR